MSDYDTTVSDQGINNIKIRFIYMFTALKVWLCGNDFGEFIPSHIATDFVMNGPDVQSLKSSKSAKALQLNH